MKMVKKHVNEKDFETLKKVLKENILKEGFSILSEYDFEKILTSKGMNCSGNAYVLNICNPSKAEKILASDISLGIHLPCKIGIFQENDGYSVIYPEPISAMESEDPAVKETLGKVSDSLKRIIATFE